MRVSDEDWALAVSAIRGEIYDQLSSDQQNKMLLATWTFQDGFPESPPSEWDWSGYRDSSQLAKQRIVDVVKALLRTWNTRIDYSRIKAQAEESRKLREVLRQEMPEIFESED